MNRDATVPLSLYFHLPFCETLCRRPRAIPQYTLGCARFKEIFSEVEAAVPGLFIGGNARDGISLAHCIESGRRLARATVQA